LIRLLVRLLALTHVLLTVTQHPVHSLRQLPRRRHHRLGATATRLDPAVERPQGILGVMAALRRHPQRARYPVGPATCPTLEDLAPAAAVLRAQAPPADEVLLVRKRAQVHADLAQDHQRRRLADPLDLRQIHPRHLEQQHPRPETYLVLLRLPLARGRRQRCSLAFVLHRPQALLDPPLAFPQLLLIEVVKRQRLLQREQQLRPPVAL